MTEEIWKDIKGYEGLYKISSLGRVRSLVRNILLKGNVDRYGYLHYVLTDKKHHTAHRLVALHFLPTDNYQLQVNHIDGDKLNNTISNLEWLTNKANKIHSIVVLGNSIKGERNPAVKLTEIEVGKIKHQLRKGVTQHRIAEQFNISRSTISMIAIKHIWSHIN